MGFKGLNVQRQVKVEVEVKPDLVLILASKDTVGLRFVGLRGRFDSHNVRLRIVCALRTARVAADFPPRSFRQGENRSINK